MESADGDGNGRCVFSHCYEICWSKKAGLDQTLLSLSLSLFIGLSVRPLLCCSWVAFKKISANGSVFLSHFHVPHPFLKERKKCEVARVDMLLFPFSVNLISLLGEYEGQVTELNTTQVSLELSCKATTPPDFITAL